MALTETVGRFSLCSTLQKAMFYHRLECELSSKEGWMMQRVIFIIVCMVLALVLSGCGSSSGSSSEETSDYVVFDEMNESMQEMYTEDLGFSREFLYSITEEDLNICNDEESLDDEAKQWCEAAYYTDGLGDDYVNDYTLESWMGMLPDDMKLNEIIMPGSHDSGIYECNYPSDIIPFITLPTKAGIADAERAQRNLALTQNLNIFQQLAYGTRYFDIRTELRFGKPYTYHRTEVAGADLGCTGDLLFNILAQVFEFLKHHKTETVILKFSHFRTVGAMNHTIAMTDWFLEKFRDMIYTSDSQRNLAEVPLKELRGKAVFLYYDPDHNTTVNSLFGRHAYMEAAQFDKDKNVVNAFYHPYPFQNALLVFDEYADTETLDYMIGDQLTKQIKVFGMNQPYLSLLSWTLTPPGGIWSVIRTDQAIKNEYSIKKLAWSLENRDSTYNIPEGANWWLPLPLSASFADGRNMPNIVYYDYVEPFLNTLIINYNFATQPQKPISDRYTVNINGAPSTYLYSVTQSQVALGAVFPMIYGVLNYKDLIQDGKSVFRIDYIFWSTAPASWWSSVPKTPGIYPVFDNAEKLKLSDLKLQEYSYWLGSGNSFRFTMEKMPKVFPTLE